MIISRLKENHKGRRVVYTPHHNLIEFGRISSWNEKFVFVYYDVGLHTQATSPEDLIMLDKGICKKCFDNRVNSKEIKPPPLDFDKLWDNGLSWCLMLNASVNAEVPRRCPYALEHLMETQND